MAAAPVPVRDSAKLALDALLVNVKLPDAVPVAFGVNFTEYGADCPAAIVTGRVSPEITNSLLLEFAADTVTAAPVAVRLPLNVAFDPTATLPKLRVVGEKDNCPEAPPIPDSGMLRAAFEAFDVSARFPVTAPALVGA